MGAKEPDKSDLDPTMQLERKGNNLASVLHRLEGDEAIREEIQDWMEMIVPGIENIQTEHQRLDGRIALLFKEEGIEKSVPSPSSFRRDDVRTLFAGRRSRRTFRLWNDVD